MAMTVIKDERVTCPRCGEQTTRTKDWGQAGKLFVHKDTIVSGIPVQEACHIQRGELTNGLKWTTKK